MTWQRPAKMQLIEDYRIDCLINLWPKIDPDWWGTMPRLIFQLPAEPSTDVLHPACLATAALVATLLKQDQLRAALVLCEAGKTRSAFFAAVVYRHFHGITGAEALAAVTVAVKGITLKPSMVSYLRGVN